MKDKQFIIGEIQRIAALNGGKPVGVDRFRTEAGIAEHEWRGTHWARWSDALSEAGFSPLEWTTGLSVEEILEILAKLVRQYGKYPTVSEILIEKRTNQIVPTPKALVRKLGAKTEAIKKLFDYCSSREEYADVAAILAQDVNGARLEVELLVGRTGAGKLKPSGFVYLIKSGKRYKVGMTASRWQRMSTIDQQTSEGVEKVIHFISTYDDAPGIESYWKARFKEKCVKGEWFELSAEDISAFKKRKFM